MVAQLQSSGEQPNYNLFWTIWLLFPHIWTLTDRECHAPGRETEEFWIEHFATRNVYQPKSTMIKKLSRVDLIMLVLAFLSLIVSETMWFTGEQQGALFIGLWVPSILGFAIYLKLLKIDKDD